MKILIVGTAAQMLIKLRGDFIKELILRGHVVYTWASDNNDEISEQLRKLGIIHCDVDFSRTGVNPIADWLFKLRLKKMILKIKPDVFIGFGIKSVCYGIPIAHQCKVSVKSALITGLGYVFIPSNDLKRKIAFYIAKFLYRRALNLADVVMFHNEDDMQLMIDEKICPQHVNATVINGSGVDMQYFREASLKEQPNFLMIGRLLKDKGVYEYIESAKIVKRQRPDATFSLLGPIDSNPTGISRDEVDRWSSEGIIKYFEPANDVRPYIADASIFVLPSYREGLPRATLEAMSMGRPVITTDTPGCRQTINGENGFLVPIKNSSALAEKMMLFIDNPEIITTMGKAARKFVAENFDVNVVNQAMIDAMKIH